MPNKALTVFEEVMLAIIGAAEVELPIFVKSPQGIMVLNTSESFLNNLLGKLTTPATATSTTPAP